MSLVLGRAEGTADVRQTLLETRQTASENPPND